LDVILRRHLDFRDYLIAHENEANEYARLKLELASRYRDDIDGYMQGKDGFIKTILLKAQAAPWIGKLRFTPFAAPYTPGNGC
jgi:GrpB-like predicted nucleotidyltransferase (UPF0157 family)